jgi:hypothetical protein
LRACISGLPSRWRGASVAGQRACSTDPIEKMFLGNWETNMSRCLAGIFAVAFLATALSAQEQTSVALQGNNIEVKYAAQSMKGRKIFGAAVPYGQVWRIGDKVAATFHTDSDLAFYGMTVPKGDYTLYVLPAADKWQLIINKQKGAGAYDPKLDVGRVTMTVGKAPAPVETCKVTLTKTAALSGKLELAWENTVASVPFRLDMMASDREW